MQQILLVAIGGAAGSVLRFLCGTAVAQRVETTMPYGTLAVNLIGSLIIGILWGLLSKDSTLNSWLVPLFMIGFCGGFTTFSSFSLENMKLLESGQWMTALTYILSSNILGITLAFVGYRFATSIF